MKKAYPDKNCINIIVELSDVEKSMDIYIEFENETLLKLTV